MNIDIAVKAETTAHNILIAAMKAGVLHLKFRLRSHEPMQLTMVPKMISDA
jgi:hypothetical protein